MHNSLIPNFKFLQPSLRPLRQAQEQAQDRRTLDLKSLCLLLLTMIFVGCSSTSNMPEGEILYDGIKNVNYTISSVNEEKYNDHLNNTKIEVEAALASPPNGSLFGSSRIKSILPLRLWIYNANANAEKGLGKWLRDHFGSQWRTISSVNPEMHATVAKNVLKNYGFFNSNVTSNVVQLKNPKKAKVSYNVVINDVYLIDSVERVGFPQHIDSAMEASRENFKIRKGTPFSFADIDAERTRLAEMLRNDGYYYFNKEYIVYTADSVSTPGKILLRIQPAPNVPETAYKRWYIGKVRIQMRKNIFERPTDSLVRRSLTILYNQKRPLRPSVLLRDITFKTGEAYNYDKYAETVQDISSTGLFSSIDFSFVPRANTDTLDVTLNCLLDKPYNFNFEANAQGNSNSRFGPQIRVSLDKHNAFHGAEKLSVGLFGEYQWKLNNRGSDNSESNDYYVYGADLSLEIPRLQTPFKLFRGHRHHFSTTPSTKFTIQYQIQNRPNLFRYETFSADATYKWQFKETVVHKFSPLTIKYPHLANRTARFDSLSQSNPALIKMFENRLVPQMNYTFSYASPSNIWNPLNFWVSIAESGNILNLAYTVTGKKWNEKDKKILNNTFAQFLKLETDFVKKWQVSQNSHLVAHLSGGLIYSFGNSKKDDIPYDELFYVGGANSLRAFPAHGIGPGNLGYLQNTSFIELVRAGSMKFEANLEYRFNIVGNLHGAGFVDMGNVWYMDWPDNNFLKQLASDVGVGIRYDIGILVLRLDWAAALHLPYNTEKTGYFNVDNFKRNQTLHFAIGYPF